MQQLPTQNNMFSVIFCPWRTAEILNTIISAADGHNIKAMEIGTPKCNRRLNTELERRSISYRISNCYCNEGFLLNPAFIGIGQIVKAINLLCEDYNQRGQ